MIVQYLFHIFGMMLMFWCKSQLQACLSKMFACDFFVGTIKTWWKSPRNHSNDSCLRSRNPLPFYTDVHLDLMAKLSSNRKLPAPNINKSSLKKCWTCISKNKPSSNSTHIIRIWRKKHIQVYTTLHPIHPCHIDSKSIFRSTAPALWLRVESRRSLRNCLGQGEIWMRFGICFVWVIWWIFFLKSYPAKSWGYSMFFGGILYVFLMGFGRFGLEMILRRVLPSNPKCLAMLHSSSTPEWFFVAAPQKSRHLEFPSRKKKDHEELTIWKTLPDKKPNHPNHPNPLIS